MESFQISRLASEILLFIFLHLDLPQLVVCRRVNKQFQEVIDNNQLLWRIFEWEQKDEESFMLALDMFDQNSRSSLEKVSIQEQVSNEDDLLHLMQVLKRSKEALSEFTLKIIAPYRIGTQVAELVAAGSRLRRLIVWDSEANSDTFPFARLELSDPKDQGSSFRQLQLLWVYNGVKKVDSKHLNSLISFAQGMRTESLECRELIRNFSKTIVHLKLQIDNQEPTIEPFFCPNLKIFEGWITDGVSSLFDAPQLQALVVETIEKSDFNGIPPSVEEIWLRSRSHDLILAEEWEPLLRHCPKLRRLKLTEEFVSESSDPPYFDYAGLLEVLESRKRTAEDGKEIDGIKIVSLQKLVLPTQFISKGDLNRASEVSEEVIDVKDYPEFIEIEY